MDYYLYLFLMLLTLILLPLAAFTFLSFFEKTSYKFIRNFSLLWSLLIFNFTVLILFFFDSNATDFQFLELNDWLRSINIHLVFGIDGLALVLIQLTAFIIPICIILSWNVNLIAHTKDYVASFFILESILFGIFSSLDLLFFYLLFEAVLIPMFFIVSFYGSRQRRIRAVYLLFLYTLFSSLVMFLAILFIFFQFGSTNYLILKTVVFDSYSERLIWLAFFFSFAVKMPLVPFHIWLPEAHCEAPTSGSVLLAGILLKLGGFGFLRYSIGLFEDASCFFTPLVYTISVFGVIYASLSTIQQIDLKKIIAYSSIGHMAVVMIGIFSTISQGLLGAVFLMISHGIVSSALFLLIGLLYDRHHTRIVKYYSGLLVAMPLFSTLFGLFTFANIGLPGTSSFICEFLIIAGAFITNSWVGFFCSSTMVLSAGYGLWLLNRLLFGNIKRYSIQEFRDLTRREFFYLLPFASLTILLGLYPEILIFYIYF